MVHSYEGGIVPTADVNESLEEGLQSQWEKSRDNMLEHFREFRFNLGLEEIFSFIRSINKYADNRTPWKLAKSDHPDARKELRTCLATMLEALRLVSVAISPVMPQVHAQIHERMNLEPSKFWKDEMVWGNTLVGKKLQEKIILFPRE